MMEKYCKNYPSWRHDNVAFKRNEIFENFTHQAFCFLRDFCGSMLQRPSMLPYLKKNFPAFVANAFLLMGCVLYFFSKWALFDLDVLGLEPRRFKRWAQLLHPR